MSDRLPLTQHDYRSEQTGLLPPFDIADPGVQSKIPGKCPPAHLLVLVLVLVAIVLGAGHLQCGWLRRRVV